MPVWTLYTGGALLLSAVGFGAGWQTRDWKADSEELIQVQAGIKLGKEQQQLADYKAGLYEGARHEAEAQRVVRDTEIRTIYRTLPPVSLDCEPPADAIRVLDNAIKSANSQVAGKPQSTVSSDTSETYPIY